MRRPYMQGRGFKLIEMWECEWWKLYKTTKIVKQHIREHFTYRRSLAAEQLSEKIKEGMLIRYMQFDSEVLENLRSNFDDFLPIFKNTLISKTDIGDFIKNYAEEETLLSQPEKMLISTLTLQNGTPTTPWLLFYPQLTLVCTKKTPFSWVHSKETLRQFCAVGSGRKNARWRKSKLKCRRRNNEAFS